MYIDTREVDGLIKHGVHFLPKGVAIDSPMTVCGAEEKIAWKINFSVTTFFSCAFNLEIVLLPDLRINTRGLDGLVKHGVDFTLNGFSFDSPHVHLLLVVEKPMLPLPH